uniref:Uncharacterized protein n=1 Tax=Oryza brachyantha TaxID=4533 RepID=J3L6W9_ORYBR
MMEMLMYNQPLTDDMTPLVHVRDIFRAQVFLAERSESPAAAAGERCICRGANTTVARPARFLAGKFPQYDVKTASSLLSL